MSYAMVKEIEKRYSYNSAGEDWQNAYMLLAFKAQSGMKM